MRAVSLDAGGVLLLPEPARVRAALAPVLGGRGRPVGVPPGDRARGALLADDRLVAAHYAGMLAFDRPTGSAAVRTLRYRTAYAAALGLGGETLTAAVAALGSCFAEPGLWSSPAPGARLVVRLLAARRLPVVVVSNTEHGDAAVLLARAGIWPDPAPVAAGRDGRVPGPAFGSPLGPRIGPPVVDSTIVGTAKPDPRIFRHALAVLDLPAEAVLHVGDSAAADVAGAEAAGLAAVHLDPLDRCPVRSHRHIAALAELLDLLDADGPPEPDASSAPFAGPARRGRLDEAGPSAAPLSHERG